MSDKRKQEILRSIVKGAREELSNDEIIELILGQTVSEKPEKKRKESFGERAADVFARFAGSWKFVLICVGILLTWVIVNSVMAALSFDPYPFILLNLALSCVAALQAPLIMMSQNRQEDKDRERAEADYRVNLKSEIIIGELYKNVERVMRDQRKILKAIEGLEQERQA